MSPNVPSRRRVALLIETTNRYARDLLHGIHDWVSAHERWSIRLAAPGLHLAATGWLSGWQGDGIIARVDSAAIATSLRRMRLPVVDVSAERRHSEFPRISINNEAVAAMAAAHLAAPSRFSCYTYCGDDRFLWSRQRGRAFRRILRQRGLTCVEVREHRGGARLLRVSELARWLKGLRTPAAVFACYDHMAHRVIEACHYAGLSVPDEIAVLGVDDDELICDFCDPPLSSILPNARRTGFEAAALLSKLMAGEAAAPSVLPEVDPLRVVERQSTAVDAISDRHVAAALRYIREHACDGINVAAVLRHVPVSRTLLEQKFLRFVGATPHQVIKRRQIERMRQLLAESDIPIAFIADVTGTESPSYMSAMFRREVGESPRAYRSRHRQ